LQNLECKYINNLLAYQSPFVKLQMMNCPLLTWIVWGLVDPEKHQLATDLWLFCPHIDLAIKNQKNLNNYVIGTVRDG